MGRLTEVKAFLNESSKNASSDYYLAHNYQCVPITQELREARIEFQEEWKK